MLEIRKTAIALNEEEMLELEGIITDRNEKEALRFLRKTVYDKIVHSQQGKLSLSRATAASTKSCKLQYPKGVQA